MAAFDEDSRVTIKTINKDSEGNPTGANLVVEMSLGELRDWLAEEFDGVFEPATP